MRMEDQGWSMAACAVEPRSEAMRMCADGQWWGVGREGSEGKCHSELHLLRLFLPCRKETGSIANKRTV